MAEPACGAGRARASSINVADVDSSGAGSRTAVDVETAAELSSDACGAVGGPDMRNSGGCTGAWEDPAPGRLGAGAWALMAAFFAASCISASLLQELDDFLFIVVVDGIVMRDAGCDEMRRMSRRYRDAFRDQISRYVSGLHASDLRCRHGRRSTPSLHIRIRRACNAACYSNSITHSSS